MRTIEAEREIEVHRTIDLTAESPRVSTEIRRAQAHKAWRASRRRRIGLGTIDSIADASMATGGLLLANVSLRLNIGTPRGIAGILLGIALIGLGAVIAVARRGRSGGTDPAASAHAVTITLDEPSPRVISLDLPKHHRTAA